MRNLKKDDGANRCSDQAAGSYWLKPNLVHMSQSALLRFTVIDDDDCEDDIKDGKYDDEIWHGSYFLACFAFSKNRDFCELMKLWWVIFLRKSIFHDFFISAVKEQSLKKSLIKLKFVKVKPQESIMRLKRCLWIKSYAEVSMFWR